MNETEDDIRKQILLDTARIVHPAPEFSAQVIRILCENRERAILRLAKQFDVWTWVFDDERVEFVDRRTWERRSEKWLENWLKEAS